jgi:hypothetical protein
MDSRLIFLHYRNSIKTRWGDADSSFQKATVSFWRGEELRIGKSAGASARKSL